MRKDSDFDISFYSGTGCGGQHRNRHMNSARIVHIPTGIVRQAQTRSRENSVQNAMQALTAELNRQAGLVTGNAINGIRKAQIGSGERSDKRRTLRFQENRVHDHVTGKSALLDKVMKGDFHLLW